MIDALPTTRATKPSRVLRKVAIMRRRVQKRLGWDSYVQRGNYLLTFILQTIAICGAFGGYIYKMREDNAVERAEHKTFVVQVANDQRRQAIASEKQATAQTEELKLIREQNKWFHKAPGGMDGRPRTRPLR